MSQVYQVRLASSVTHTLSASDEMRHRVELTQILGQDEMREILKKSLEDAGWEEQEDGTYKKQGPSGEELVWDLDEGVVRATVEEEREVTTDVASTGYGESKGGAQRDAERSLERQKSRAEREVKRSEAEIERKITEQLEASEEKRMRELNGVVQRVYSEALKRKAEQLGTVVSVEENQAGDDYELVIKINN